MGRVLAKYVGLFTGKERKGGEGEGLKGLRRVVEEAQAGERLPPIRKEERKGGKKLGLKKHKGEMMG